MKKQCWQCGKLIQNVGDRRGTSYDLCKKCKVKQSTEVKK